MNRRITYCCVLAVAAALSGAFLVPADVWGGVTAHYLYNLSDFNGTVPYDSPRIFIDSDRSEVYVLHMNAVGVFNDAGMEIFRFSYEPDTNTVTDLTVDEQGDILVLSYQGPYYRVVRCNFRGELKDAIAITDVPKEFSSLMPSRLVRRMGKLYLADANSMKIVVTDGNGRFLQGFDLVQVLQLREQDRNSTGITGFNVDPEGNMLFTISVLFSAYRLSPDGALESFGQPGSAPGKFNIVGGIATDRRGNYLVTDVLKGVVMVFDRDFRFLTQFGTYGTKPGDLIGPKDLHMDGQGRLYVTQGRKRGVSVFRLAYD